MSDKPKIYRLWLNPEAVKRALEHRSDECYLLSDRERNQGENAKYYTIEVLVTDEDLEKR